MSDKKIKIATHDGKFHADEVFAVATLLLALGKKIEDDDIEIIRTRDQSLINQADYVFDVGAVYDHSNRRYDHHQEGGAGEDAGVPYSSFGLAWKHYGEGVAGSKEVSDLINKMLVKSIDAVDNGMGKRRTEILPGVKCYVIDDLVSVWNSFDDRENDDVQFGKACRLAMEIISREVRVLERRARDEKIVDKIVGERNDKKIVILEEDFHIDGHSFWSKYEDILFVVSKDDEGWKLMTTRDDPMGFVSRKVLPKEWGGKRDEELQKITGVSDAIFCHRGLWLAGAKSKEGILKMAEIALESNE